MKSLLAQQLTVMEQTIIRLHAGEDFPPPYTAKRPHFVAKRVPEAARGRARNTATAKRQLDRKRQRAPVDVWASRILSRWLLDLMLVSLWGKPPVRGDTTPRHEPGTGRDQSRNTPQGG